MSADIWLETDCCGSHDHNITHNVGGMLRQAGLDWHDYQGGLLTSSALLDEVLHAYDNLIAQPEVYRPMGASNGWGTYDQVLPFLLRLARDCIRHPEATVRVSL